MLESQFQIRKYRNEDCAEIHKLFNYYVTQSWAAYPENEVELSFIQSLMYNYGDYPVYVVENDQKALIGFGMLRKYHFSSSFDRVAELTYFIYPDYTSIGLGSQLIEKLILDARKRSIVSVLASISSKNIQSLKFHKKHGFKICGKFHKIGLKFNQVFDVVWMQKFISN
jgi:L-amino acid N-acyltransferase YncA